MKVTIEIADEDIRAALQTAAESGIGYWAEELVGIDGLLSEVWVTEREGVADTCHTLDIERGLRMMLQREVQTDGAALGRGQSPRWWDADQADAFVQYAAFGKLVYG